MSHFHVNDSFRYILCSKSCKILRSFNHKLTSAYPLLNCAVNFFCDVWEREIEKSLPTRIIRWISTIPKFRYAVIESYRRVDVFYIFQLTPWVIFVLKKGYASLFVFCKTKTMLCHSNWCALLIHIEKWRPYAIIKLIVKLFIFS